MNDVGMPHRIPDYSQYIVGWRVWAVREMTTSSQVRLHSVYRGTKWEPGESLRSHVRREDRSEDGIFAFKKPTYIPLGNMFPYVYGRVALWGVCAEHTNGYRAEFAYPLSIARLSGRSDINQLCKIYGLQHEKRTWPSATLDTIVGVSSFVLCWMVFGTIFFMGLAILLRFIKSQL